MFRTDTVSHSTINLTSLPIRFADTLLTWHDRAQQRRLLRTLDDRMLKDVGLGWGQAVEEASKPFWQA